MHRRSNRASCGRSGHGGLAAAAAAALGLLALVVTACGGATSRTGPVETASTEELGEATEEARSLVKEAYASLRRGKVGGLQPLLSETVFVVGPGPEQVYSERAQALDALGLILPTSNKHRIKSRRLVAVSSPSGTSAWVAAELRFGKASLRLTAVMAEIDEIWTIVAMALSVPVSDKEVEQLEPDQARPAPSIVQGGVDDAAAEAARLFEQAAAAPEQWAEQLADRRDVVAIGGPGKEFKRGPKSIRRAWKKALKSHPKVTLRGAMRASVTPDGALAWLVADVEASHDDMKPTPHRYFAIYERSPQGWRMVAIHQAVVTPAS